MPYPAVIQPRPELRSHDGMDSSMDAVQSAWVSPKRARQEPSACLFTLVSSTMSRSWSKARPEGRIKSTSLGWLYRKDGRPEHAGATLRRAASRPEERRVGKACVGQCRSRWSPDH